MSGEHAGSKPSAQAPGDALHVTDEPVELGDTPFEGWLALGLFWLLGATVLYQFVTRYVFNDSAAWTEEIARYLLIGTVFVGAAVGVHKDNHIQVDLLERRLPPRHARRLALAVRAVSAAFFAALAGLTLLLMQKLGDYRMTIAPLPMNLLYGVCFFGFAAMTWRALGVLRRRYRAPLESTPAAPAPDAEA
jgi:TRAP-type transport system small permease protein